ncbi:MAG TPA: enoyl-CoA hydratase-related protein [Chloroflexia bacterium]|nr:enoyl-CoA hydratase-related protein [Chloroflexia bacterium]
MMAHYINLLVDIDRETHVALITINRADKLNALNRALLTELDAALDEVANDGSVRALVITGAGAIAFVAGADIAEISALEGEESGKEFARFGQRVFSKIERLTIPVVMAINGYALGGGCELALSGDIRIASETAQLGQPEVNLGVIPGYGGTQRLARIIGRDRAKGLIFTGERVGAQDAYRIGLVDRVVPAADLVDEALSLARNLASKAPRALALAKIAINEGISLPLDDALELEAGLFAQAIETQDSKEGAAAFLEKRQPQWTSH